MLVWYGGDKTEGLHYRLTETVFKLLKSNLRKEKQAQTYSESNLLEYEYL